MEKKELDILDDETLNDFILNSPPSTAGYYRISNYVRGLTPYIKLPNIAAYCTNEKCNGTRQFQCNMSHLVAGKELYSYTQYTYTCKNCADNDLLFFLGVLSLKDTGIISLIKIGEWPPLTHITPTKLLSMFGDKKDIYLKGRKCEHEGLGIGSFVYYRRIVEETKNELMDLIINALKVTNAKEEVIGEFKKAKELKSFDRSVEKVKSIFPQELKIMGQNPLTLLHKALSIGVHKMSDQECLNKAKEIRIILFEFINRLKQISKENAELKDAIKKLSS